MWTAEDIEAMNPPEGGQRRAFLSHLYESGAATAWDLTTWSDRLDELGGAHVICSCQLPFTLALSNRAFRVQGSRAGVYMDLSFLARHGVVDSSGRLRLTGGADSENRPVASAEVETCFTHVTGTLRLWGRRASLYERYRECLGESGLRDQVLGKPGRNADAHLSSPTHPGTFPTARSFESEVARRAHQEFQAAIYRALGAYSIAALDEVDVAGPLYGYFVLIAPGRVSGSAPLLPVICGLARRPTSGSPRSVTQDRTSDLLDRSLPLGDRVVRQLMAMNRLHGQKERELALVGCITTIEWFLNAKFGAAAKARLGENHNRSLALSKLLRAGVLPFLSDDLRARLKSAAEVRNGLVHGPPPNRVGFDANEATESAFAGFDVEEFLYTAFEVYRLTNEFTRSRAS